ncbi:hypothetical protein [Streptomyces beihaiensis]|uniref:Uncharacterized protein n=1 Tax=Streptomyces beihaiensis TaxID=2984495 RepID=A0ABT3TQ93_9ACTN|nr:hypothetical protein [Streptomyces beihaiensis]MCX3058285.1 hypothetical protein [Streptomyces beihaiensis]
MRWGERPVGVRWTAAAYVTGFLEGAGAHAYFLVKSGPHAYAYAPVLIQLLFHGLVLLDPLVALLTAMGRPVGPPVAAAVMTADLVANWVVEWSAVRADPLAFLRPAGLLPISVFGVFVLASAVPMRRALMSDG